MPLLMIVRTFKQAEWLTKEEYSSELKEARKARQPEDRTKKPFHYDESGVTSLETIAAVVLLGMMASLFLLALSTICKADFILIERASAESLARNQMEYIMAQDYINFAEPEHEEYQLVTAPSTHTFQFATLPIEPSTGELLGAEQDNGVQRITVTVRRQDEQVITLESYKVNR